MRDINRVNDNCISHRHVTDGGAGRRPRSSSREVSHPRASLAPPRRDAVGPVGKSTAYKLADWRARTVGWIVECQSPRPDGAAAACCNSLFSWYFWWSVVSCGVSARPPRAAPDNTDLHSSASTHSPTGSSVVPTFRPWACSWAMAALASSFCSGVWYQIPDLLDGESVLCSSWRGGRTHVLTTAP